MPPEDPGPPDPLDQLAEFDADEPGHTRLWPVLLTLGIVLGEAVALGIAARISGSAVLFAEAAQSLAGAGVEVFLLVGVRRASRPADERHPLGYGREAFFWSLLASVGVFVGGGVVSITYGLRALNRPEEGSAYLLGYVLLAIVVVADGWTLRTALTPLLSSPVVGRLGLRRGLRQTSDAAARTLFFDNAAAVVGSVIGIVGLAVHQAFGLPQADAVASLLIGVLLLATTVVLLNVNRELLTDHTIAPEIVDAMRTRVLADDRVTDVPELLVVYTGPRAALVTGTVAVHHAVSLADADEVLQGIRDRLCRQWPGELRVYLSPVAGTPACGRADQ